MCRPREIASDMATPDVALFLRGSKILPKETEFAVHVVPEKYWAPLYGSHVVARMLQAN